MILSLVELGLSASWLLIKTVWRTGRYLCGQSYEDPTEARLRQLELQVLQLQEEKKKYALLPPSE